MLQWRMLHSNLRKHAYDRGKIDLECTSKPGGHVIGQLYKVHKNTKDTAFSCLRHQNIRHEVGDTILVLDLRVSDPTHGWKDVEVLINGNLGRFKIWAFQDLIDTQSIKLVN